MLTLRDRFIQKRICTAGPTFDGEHLELCGKHRESPKIDEQKTIAGRNRWKIPDASFFFHFFRCCGSKKRQSAQ